MMISFTTSQFTLTPELYPGYRLRRRRGCGGFGEVWEAENAAGDTVALKFLRCAGGCDATQELRSIQLVQKLNHCNLVRIDRVWCAGGFLVVAMELADGSLADLLDVYRAEIGTALPPSHIFPLLVQAAQALDFLNNRQHLIQGQSVTVQHCDVTLTNLLVFGKTVKLSDFGLTTTLMGVHKVHFRAGTPAYAAPEVFQGRLSNRTDQYALAICYCLLRGGYPFPDAPATFQLDYTRPVPDLGMLTPAEQSAVARSLALEPQNRWATCGELVAELQKSTSSPPVVNHAGKPNRKG